MNAKTKFLLILFFMTANISFSQEQKHVIGLSYGFQYKDGDIWVGDPYNLWIDQTASSIIEGFYYYRLSPLFQTGFLF
jgi:hypothetical protein